MNNLALPSHVSLTEPAPASGTCPVTAPKCSSHPAHSEGALKLCKAEPALFSALFVWSLSDQLQRGIPDLCLKVSRSRSA